VKQVLGSPPRIRSRARARFRAAPHRKPPRLIIKSIAASLPSRRVSNDDVIDMIREQSRNYQGDLERALKLIRRFLVTSGLKERRWCARHESPIDHVAMACDRALAETYLQPHQIELLIYVGVGRGFMEPSNSHMMANALGFSHAQCFDIVDACMSWVRALQLVDSLFKSGSYRNALVINAEFNLSDSTFLAENNFELEREEQILYTFPAYTIGEAATATLLLPKEPNNFDFYFSTNTDLSDLCSIPLKGFENYCHPSNKIGTNGALRFTSYGINLHKSGRPDLIKTFKKMSSKDEIDIIFPHASSEKEWNESAKVVNVKELLYQTYPTTGNMVSATVPAAIDSAIQSGKLNRGMRCVVWVGSAGMSFNATKFIF